MKTIIKMYVGIFFLSLSTNSIASSDDLTLQESYKELISLFFDAARTANNEVMIKFIDSGFPINEKNAKSYTALMVAAYQGHKDTVQLLLNEGANACIEDKRGNTALLGALLKGEIQIAKMLYKKKCAYEDSKNKAGLNLTQFAEVFGQAGALKMIKEDSMNKNKIAQ